MADKAYITPKVLQWARESARMSLETAAAKVSIAPEKLSEWEAGSGQPTIKQAETLAKAYKRPFAIFFLPEAPRDFTPLQDFRKKTAKPLGTASVFIIREIQQKQAWIRDVFENNNESSLPFVGRFSIQDDPVKVANDILDTLQINKDNYSIPFDGPINKWIYKAESRGIFISKTSFIHTRLKLDSEEIQGFTIADPYAPFVFINSKDWKTSQLFTLVHELAHIWIAESGISNEIEPELKHKEKLHPVELFCNEVAANALMPMEEMQSLDAAVFNSLNGVLKISQKLGVSSFAFLFRALKLQIITLDKYRKLKTLADSEYKAFLQRVDEKKAKQKKQEGGPDYYLLQLNKNGRLFTQIVLDAFRGGFVEPTMASSLLNTQVNKFSKLEAFL
ncbi:MAG: ImmA/IrrE family metallo-endopeptidase [Planctomycetes bacterium]|uniref:ImmA/IrrE family metallo-endopeptidase n=1 Tax=Candidatus Wunengus sp. YC65 TaxID=3367701 RepID=UPI001D847594|nr:ImmA/IrrE family metallo-endopeptidase [Planctomycetota bacterium]